MSQNIKKCIISDTCDLVTDDELINHLINVHNAQLSQLSLNTYGEGDVNLKVLMSKTKIFNPNTISILRHKHYHIILHFKIKKTPIGKIITHLMIYLIDVNSDDLTIAPNNAFSPECKRFSHFEITMLTGDNSIRWVGDININTNRVNCLEIVYPKNLSAFIQNKDDLDVMDLVINMRVKMIEDFSPRDLDDWTIRALEREC
jgi:hypothetical protein